MISQENSLPAAIITPFSFPKDFPCNVLSPGERIIFHAALQKSGVFAEKCICLSIGSKGLICADGHTVYALGTVPDVRPQLSSASFRGFLGRRIHAASLPTSWKKMAKDVLFLKDSTHQYPVLPTDMHIVPVHSPEERRLFAELRRDFLTEESGIPIDLDTVQRTLEPIIDAILPVLLMRDGRVLGMVSSHFHSAEGAMINMLAVRKEYRGHGWGALLLQTYANRLLHHSKTVGLFYSPENEAAKRLYKGAGFEKAEEWVMAYGETE